MTQYMLGQEGPARQNLARGLAGKSDIPEIADARDILGVLAIDPDHPAAADRALLEHVLAQRPADPGALTRLAGLYESAGEHSKAIETAQSVLKANPQHLGSWVVLAKALAQSGDQTGAMDAAKHAHDLAPDDPPIDHLVGSLALAAHNYPWAYSVLKDAVNQGGGNDAGLQSDFSRAAYSQGHVDEAIHAAELSVRQDGDSARAAATQRFINLVTFAAKPEANRASDIELLIGQDPNSVAALMAQGSIDELQMRPDAARDHFRRALESYPAFAPADRRLVLLARDDDSFDPAAKSWATAAREAYPGDPALASAGGIIAFRSHDYPRALTLLNQGLAAQPNDGEALYCLGMAQFQVKDPSAGSTLRRALNLKLRPAEAKEARKVLGETSGL
jgi:tetratricopeptide (TPR) repeat protein